VVEPWLNIVVEVVAQMAVPHPVLSCLVLEPLEAVSGKTAA